MGIYRIYHNFFCYKSVNIWLLSFSVTKSDILVSEKMNIFGLGGTPLPGDPSGCMKLWNFLRQFNVEERDQGDSKHAFLSFFVGKIQFFSKLRSQGNTYCLLGHHCLLLLGGV